MKKYSYKMNQLNTPKETINFYRDKISDFEPFFVSLQDKNYTYVLEKKNNEWNIRTFNKITYAVKWNSMGFVMRYKKPPRDESQVN